MLSIQQPLLVFSDLDGTLLDSHSYDWRGKQPGKPFAEAKCSRHSL
ncbi:Mannosyl-3-phosphoglycerate phosphatase [Escherichia coli]|nr:Mannosyl-3-phosphoglycerate phosphatase [Escherichia coli]